MTPKNRPSFLGELFGALSSIGGISVSVCICIQQLYALLALLFNPLRRKTNPPPKRTSKSGTRKYE